MKMKKIRFYISIILMILMLSPVALVHGAEATQDGQEKQDLQADQESNSEQAANIEQTEQEADEGQEGQSVEKIELTIEKALEQAELHSRQAVIDDLEIIAKETAFRKAKKDADMEGDRSGSEDVINNRIKIQARAIEAEGDYEAAKLAKAEHTRQLKLDVTNTFYSILLAEKELEKETKKLEIKKERLAMAQAQYAAKNITIDDLEAVQYEIDMKTLEVDNINEKLKSLDMQMKNLLNLPFSGVSLKLKGTLTLERFIENDINKIANEYIEKDLSVYSAAYRYETAKKVMEETEKFLRKGSDLYDDNRVELESALRDYDAAKRNAEMNIRNIYNELLNLGDNVILAQKYEELMSKILESAKVKYDKGIISKDAYLTAEEQYIDSKYGVYKAIYDFNMKLYKFNSMTEG